MQLKKLDKNAVKYWFLINAIWSLLILVSSLLAMILCSASVKLAVCLSVGIPAVIFISLLMVFPWLKYRYYSYGYDNDKIVINKGVIFRHRIVVPVCQLQDLHIFEGPILMAFKLCGLIVSTAGSNFELVCLTREDAKKIIEDLEMYLKKKVEA